MKSKRAFSISKQLLAFLAVMISGLTLGAQTFSGSASKTKVGVGDRFRITYRIENIQNAGFKLPALDGFGIAGGPYQSQQTSVVNGAMTQSFQIAYDLVANKKGKLTIPPAVLTNSKGSYKSNAIEVEVVEGSLGNQTSGQNENKISGGEVIVTATANRSSVYEGEQVELTIRLYSQYNNVSIEEIKFPEFSGGWVQDVEDAIDTRFRQETYKGKRYNVATLRKSVLIPQQSGALTFDAVTARIMVQKVIKSNDWMDMFYGGKVQEERLNVNSAKITFNVLPLPEGKPASFRNAVGKLEFKAELDKSEAQANDPVTLKITISGNGNLMLLDKPVISFPKSFEVPEPIVNDNYRVSSSGISGNKTFEYLLIPRSGGNFKINPIAFSFFDPKTKKYVELLSDTLRLKVNGAVIENFSTGGSKDVEMIGTDIRYIRENDYRLEGKKAFFFRSPLYFMLALLPFALLGATVGFRRKLFNRQVDHVQKRMKVADSVAMRRLNEAKRLMNEGGKDKYYEELNKALLGYLRDKFGIDFADLNRGFIREKLRGKNVSEPLIDSVIHIIDTCEFARFAPASGEERADIYNETVTLINALEKNS